MSRSCRETRKALPVVCLTLLLLSVVTLLVGPVVDFAHVEFHDHDTVATGTPATDTGSVLVSPHDHDTCGPGPTCTPALAKAFDTWTRVHHEPDGYLVVDLSRADIWTPDARAPIPIV